MSMQVMFAVSVIETKNLGYIWAYKSMSLKLAIYCIGYKKWCRVCLGHTSQSNLKIFQELLGASFYIMTSVDEKASLTMQKVPYF